MFLVKDSLKKRHSRIRRYLTTSDPAAALYLAAADFEWTISRAIIAGGSNRNTSIRKSLKKSRGVRGYEELWEKEVTPRASATLEEVIVNSKLLAGAFSLRNKLVHGAKTSTGPGFLSKAVEASLAASLAVVGFFSAHGIDLYDRLPVRLKPTNAKLIRVA
jgi:hypothetical protein